MISGGWAHGLVAGCAGRQGPAPTSYGGVRFARYASPDERRGKVGFRKVGCPAHDPTQDGPVLLLDRQPVLLPCLNPNRKARTRDGVSGRVASAPQRGSLQVARRESVRGRAHLGPVRLGLPPSGRGTLGRILRRSLRGTQGRGGLRSPTARSRVRGGERFGRRAPLQRQPVLGRLRGGPAQDR